MPVIESHGCPIDVEITGPATAPVLLLSSSLGTTKHMWDPQMPAFTKDYRVVRFDRRGHGRSGVPKGPYSMEMLGPRRARDHGQPETRQGQLARPVDGRHGRHVARRQCRTSLQ
jgi:pimeloyl-ACP methyl ester carboxylesterase